MINVKYLGNLRNLIGKTEEKFEVNTVEELMRCLKKKYGQAVYLEIRKSHIMLNGSRLQQRILRNSSLNQEDCIVFFPVCGGG